MQIKILCNYTIIKFNIFLSISAQFIKFRQFLWSVSPISILYGFMLLPLRHISPLAAPSKPPYLSNNACMTLGRTMGGGWGEWLYLPCIHKAYFIISFMICPLCLSFWCCRGNCECHVGSQKLHFWTIFCIIPSGIKMQKYTNLYILWISFQAWFFLLTPPVSWPFKKMVKSNNQQKCWQFVEQAQVYVTDLKLSRNALAKRNRRVRV